MNITNMMMEKLRVLFEKIGRLTSRDTQSMSIYKGSFPAPHHLLEINAGSGKKRTFAISDFKHYYVRATEMKDMLVIIVATSLRVKTVNPITRELPGRYSRPQGKTTIILTHHFTFCLLMCPDARLNF